MERMSLAKLCGKSSSEEFMTSVLERQVLHSEKCVSSFEIEALLSTQTLNSLFARYPLQPSRYQLIKDGTVDRDAPRHSAGGMDPKYIAAAYAEGQTIRLNSVHESVPAVGALCRDLAEECKCAVFANVYMTPARNPGFDPHYDDHDVLVIQCHGSKEWRIHDEYANRTALPLAGFQFDAQKYVPGPPTRSLMLNAGDTLYIPRGHMHSARAQDAGSVHITLSLNWPTWNELLMDVIARSSLDDVDMRRAIVSSCQSHGDAMPHIRALLDRAFESRAVEDSLGSLLSGYKGAYLEGDPIGVVAGTEYLSVAGEGAP